MYRVTFVLCTGRNPAVVPAVSYDYITHYTVVSHYTVPREKSVLLLCDISSKFFDTLLSFIIGNIIAHVGRVGC